MDGIAIIHLNFIQRTCSFKFALKSESCYNLLNVLVRFLSSNSLCVLCVFRKQWQRKCLKDKKRSQERERGRERQNTFSLEEFVYNPSPPSHPNTASSISFFH